MDPTNGNDNNVPMQVADATVRSNDSSSHTTANNMTAGVPKQDDKIKAYVDFTEFNKNYEDYLKKKQEAELQSRNNSNANSEGKSSSSEDWEILEP